MSSQTKSSTQLALELLHAAKLQACQLLKEGGTEMLAARVDNTLGQLINQLAHASGVDMSTATVAATPAVEKPKHFLGVPLEGVPQPINIAKMEENVKNLSSQIQELTEQAFADILTMEPAVLKETYGELIIRAVAVKAGMDVTPTYPEKINVAFIRAVAEQVKIKTDQINQVNEADAAAKVATEASNTEAPESTTTEEVPVVKNPDETNANQV